MKTKALDLGPQHLRQETFKIWAERARTCWILRLQVLKGSLKGTNWVAMAPTASKDHSARDHSNTIQEIFRGSNMIKFMIFDRNQWFQNPLDK